jgi:hypothetical protein
LYVGRPRSLCLNINCLVCDNQGEENLGMAMVFTLVTHLREALVGVIQKRIARENELEQEKERQLMEVNQISHLYHHLD